MPPVQEREDGTDKSGSTVPSKLRALANRRNVVRGGLALAAVYGVIALYLIFLPRSGTGVADVTSHTANASEHVSSPLVQVFEEKLKQHNGKFYWQDWTYTAEISAYNNGELDPRIYPYVTVNDVENMVFPHAKATTSQEASLLGQLYCEYYMDAPYRVMVLNDPAEMKSLPPLLDQKIKSLKGRCHKQYKMDCSDVYPGYRPPLLKQLEGTPFSDRMQVLVDKSLYKWDILKQIRKDNKGEENAHANSLKLAIEEVGASPKFFYETPLQHDPLGYGTHYDWRFFRGIPSEFEHRAIAHDMMRAWAQFADTVGLTYWLAHGGLIGWWWNGIILPWDADNDIQMPIQELDRLAREFNGTMIIQYPGEGSRKFFIEVSPWYVQRIKGNGNNLIDARFIDVDSGMYIDITGLAKTKRKDEINCKNYHYYQYDDISPLRRSWYEGIPVYVPRKSEKILRQEYSQYDTPTFENGKWAYDERARLWIRNSTCAEYLKSFSNKSIVECTPARILPPEACDFDRLGTCDANVIDFYEASKEVTGEHMEERELWTQIDLAAGKLDSETMEKLSSLVNTYHSPIYSSKELAGLFGETSSSEKLK